MSKIDFTSPEERTVFAVWTNTDLTEGRGSEYVQCFCELQATAIRLARKKGVQGSNARVTEQHLFRSGRSWFGPVVVTSPTSEDTQVEIQLDSRRKAIARAKELGLTDDDITALRG